MRPCGDPSNNPNDWFISKDGRQYPDEEFLTEDEIRSIRRSVLRKADEADAEHQAREEAAVRASKALRRRLSIQARKAAREKCVTACPFRMECLDVALSNPTPATHGTWGGYFEEELREIRDERMRRRTLRR